MAQAGGIDRDLLVGRLRRLATLDTTVFEEVRADRSATLPALLISVCSVLLAGIGGWLWWMVNGVEEVQGTDIPSSTELFFQSVLVGGIIAFIVGGVWILITYVMLSQIFRARADVGELIRVMGFADAPLALMVLMFIPGLDFGIGVAVLAIFFATQVLAVQAATDAPPGRVLAATGAGFAVFAIILGLFVGSGSALAPGFFALDLPVEVFKDAF